VNSCSPKQPKIILGELKLKNNGLYSIIDQRNRQNIRPFILENSGKSHGSSYTRNDDKREDLSLPEIFSKDSILPSTNDSERFIIDDSRSDKSVNSTSDDDQSTFLIKLKKMSDPKEMENKDIKGLRSTAYFGSDHKHKNKEF
jgi:hypothetical protein